jgi:hypothetical protein
MIRRGVGCFARAVRRQDEPRGATGGRAVGRQGGRAAEERTVASDDRPGCACQRRTTRSRGGGLSAKGGCYARAVRRQQEPRAAAAAGSGRDCRCTRCPRLRVLATYDGTRLRRFCEDSRYARAVRRQHVGRMRDCRRTRFPGCTCSRRMTGSRGCGLAAGSSCFVW